MRRRGGGWPLPPVVNWWCLWWTKGSNQLLNQFTPTKTCLVEWVKTDPTTRGDNCWYITIVYGTHVPKNSYLSSRNWLYSAVRCFIQLRSISQGNHRNGVTLSTRSVEWVIQCMCCPCLWLPFLHCAFSNVQCAPPLRCFGILSDGTVTRTAVKILDPPEPERKIMIWWNQKCEYIMVVLNMYLKTNTKQF